MPSRWCYGVLLVAAACCVVAEPPFTFPKERMLHYREKVKNMFYHAYNGYLNHAYPYDELKPLTCTGTDTWGSFSLTLIDSLDTLVMLGNHSEFIRAVDLVLQNVDVDANVNVSVFETNIRVVGGLLSAHLLAGRVPGMQLDAGWPCSGRLLDLAVRFANKLLPAFNTVTGMPYGTVNLRYGVNRYETPITCTAGVGTFIIEFGTLSKLTGDPYYERIALRALEGLWKYRSSIGLVGNHVNVQTGAWTATDAGIGAGVDSYFEYLAKGGLLFQRPKLLEEFYDYEAAINKFIRKEDFFFWVSMTKGLVTSPMFQSLETFWPGVLALLGRTDDAARIMHSYLQISLQYGVTPEFYNLQNHETVRPGYPLRPEMLESMMYLYQTTRDPTYLTAAATMVDVIDSEARTDCGFATVKNVNDFTIEDRMESFFLAETTKYLFLIFDEDNFMHNDGSSARIINTTNGRCVAYAGGYVFNTEAHPVDPGLLYCCSAKRTEDIIKIQDFEDQIDLIDVLNLRNDDDGTGCSGDAHGTIQDGEKTNSTDSGATVEQKNVGSKVEKNRKFEFVDPRSAKTKLELLERVKLNKDVTDVIRHAIDHDQKQHEAGDFGSNISGNLVKYLIDIREDRRFALIHALSHSPDAPTPLPTLETIKLQLAKRKFIDDSPGILAFAPEACTLLDHSTDSAALKKLLVVIFSRVILPRAGIPFVSSPLCLPGDRPPTTEELYRREKPVIANATSYTQIGDVVDRLSFSKFEYRLLDTEHFELLTTPARSFASRFTGGGQVVPQSLIFG